MTQEFFPSERMCYSFSSSVPLHGANMQENVVGVLAILKSSFIASFVGYIQANENPRNGVRLLFETRVAALNPSISVGEVLRGFPPLSKLTCESGSLALLVGERCSVYSVVLEKVVLSRWCFVLRWTGREKVRQRPAKR